MTTKTITVICFLVVSTFMLSLVLKTHLITSYQLNPRDVFLQDGSR